MERGSTKITLKDLLGVCMAICDKHIGRNPRALIVYNRISMPYTVIKQNLQNVYEWCYPLKLSCLHKCVLCEECVHYRNRTCDIDNLTKPPTHYCGYAREKD